MEHCTQQITTNTACSRRSSPKYPTLHPSAPLHGCAIARPLLRFAGIAHGTCIPTRFNKLIRHIAFSVRTRFCKRKCKTRAANEVRRTCERFLFYRRFWHWPAIGALRPRCGAPLPRYLARRAWQTKHVKQGLLRFRSRVARGAHFVPCCEKSHPIEIGARQERPISNGLRFLIEYFVCGRDRSV